MSVFSIFINLFRSKPEGLTLARYRQDFEIGIYDTEWGCGEDFPF